MRRREKPESAEEWTVDKNRHKDTHDALVDVARMWVCRTLVTIVHCEKLHWPWTNARNPAVQGSVGGFEAVVREWGRSGRQRHTSSLWVEWIVGCLEN